MPHIQIIANPTAGRGNGQHAIPRIEQLLKNLNLEFSIEQTERPWHAAELAEQAAAAGCEIVVAAGGDGTVNEVINGLMLAKQRWGRASALGVLCIGSGNDFAYGASVPIGLEDGCQALAEGFRRQIDIGRISGGDIPGWRYFGNGTGIGFDAVVGYQASRLRRLRGFLSYFVAALKTVFLYYRAPLVKVEFDGQTIQKPALMVSIMNGRRLGGVFMIAPQAQLDDGLFELCIVRQVSRLRIFTLIPHFMRGTHLDQKEIQSMEAQRIAVNALEGSLPAHIDGEIITMGSKQLTIETLPVQIELICRPLKK